MRNALVLVLAVTAIVLRPLGPTPLRAAGPRDSMLISTTELAPLVDRKDPTLVVLQVGASRIFAAGHIPGARSAQMDQFIAPMDMTHAEVMKTEIMTELPTDAALHATLESFGITDRSRIVIAETENSHSTATRIYLTLVHAGLAANTQLLDGGFKAWKDAGRPVSTDTPPPTRSTMAPLKTVPVTVNAAYVQAHERTPGTVILDVRSPAAWEGTEAATDNGVSPARYGHIPSAISLPFEKLWDNATSRLRPPADLEKIFTDAGVKPTDEIIGYCYIGQRATATIFAAETLGHRAWLYDGSMDEWAKLKLPLEMPGKKDGGR
jgi:thiosulfate/3-mercaptopyruvate sulfurtransferase